MNSRGYDTRLWAALLPAALLVVLLAAALAAPVLKEKRARADAARIAAAEPRFAAAIAAAEDVRSAYLPHPASGDDEFDPVLARLDAALLDIEAARTQADAVWPSQGRSRYLRAVARAGDAVAGLRDYVKSARIARDAIADADAAYARADEAYAAAMAAGDADDFRSMLAQAEKAKALFEQARQLHAAAERVYPGSSFADWIEDSRLSAEMAATAIEMARAGADERIDDYNAGIDRLAEIENQRQAPGAGAGAPAEDAEARVLEQTAVALEDARRLHAEALELLDR